MTGVRLAPDLIEALQRADWPGNVRQLENAVARMVALSGGGEIAVAAFPGAAAIAAEPGAEPPPDGTLSLREQVEALERNVIARTLASVAGNQSEAARRLGLSRGSLIDRLKKYGFAGSATDSTAQATAPDVSGSLFVFSHARRIPSARRSASASRLVGEPSLYLPAPMFPPAPLK